MGLQGTSEVAERFRSGDGEREASMTRQMPFEPLPASVLGVRLRFLQVATSIHVVLPDRNSRCHRSLDSRQGHLTAFLVCYPHHP